MSCALVYAVSNLLSRWHTSLWAVLWAVCCLCATACAHDQVENSCDLDPLVRPVILIHGFRSSFLYNSTANYSLEYITLEDVAPGNEERGLGVLDLPLTWDGTSLTQGTTNIGPESFDGDDTPSLFLPDGTLIPLLVVVFTDVISVVRGWEASPAAKGKRLLYSVSHDWRRDVWEQAERLDAVVDEVLAATGCNPIIVAHSFGGLVTYSAIARYGSDFADKVHGVFYGASPVQPYVSSVGVFSQPTPGVGASGAVDTQFTFTSLYSLTPPASGVCADSDPILPTAGPREPRPCSPDELRTGITCKSPVCGRPEGWPEEEPFFLDVDLHDPLTWQAFGLGLPIARVLEGKTGSDVLYSEAELTHLSFALQTSARLAEVTIGSPSGDLSAAAAVADIHPPAVQLSLHLTDVEVPGQGIRDFRGHSSLECLPAPTFGELGLPQCVAYALDVPVATDGLVLSRSTVFANPELFGDKLQVFNVTEPPPFWTQLAAADPSIGFGPHSTAFQGRTTPQETFVDCGEWPARVQFDPASGGYPPLEALLCSLVRRPATDAPSESDVMPDMAAPGGTYGMEA